MRPEPPLRPSGLSVGLRLALLGWLERTQVPHPPGGLGEEQSVHLHPGDVLVHISEVLEHEKVRRTQPADQLRALFPSLGGRPGFMPGIRGEFEPVVDAEYRETTRATQLSQKSSAR